MTTEYIRLAKTDEITDGRVKVYQAHGKRVAVCNVKGTYYAVADLCTHDGGPLGEGELVDHQIECPRHGARFDIETGKVMCLPAVLPIATYKVEERNGELWVSVPETVTS